MSNPTTGRPYQKQYEEAEALFNDSTLEQCIASAKKNLDDPTLPPYYFIKNSILIACALDDWDEADPWRVSAEMVYRRSLDEAQKSKDVNSLDALEVLKTQLDELNMFRMEDLTGLTPSLIDGSIAMSELEIDDTAGLDLEDSAAVAMAENEDEVEADSMDTSTICQTPTIIVVPHAEGGQPSPVADTKKVTRKKSFKMSKGGAYHAHQFSKSRGHAAEPRASILNIDWAPRGGTPPDDKNMDYAPRK
ncbi:hypothetical protein P153DRAFT_411889 [Dothidotthia symphoricarpi CBS 119687]|uniref:Uncharacterized protein n=1 Tax=Dothidotthia symphoricarpi CBS 119687 TaxID=1392245 RepID=A0A6A6A113_9PLEO|nr:uncharacterized protein P153DRAFT_411889 [Dothidotthia symphoricarpi CBS 119687]KAF2124251.1 hypothetical protein P153DRAFT_411889 [Dothidotthia symphoricarpi CBS 119687]